MSRKRNSGGKKARDYGSSTSGGGMSKHRASGKSQINRRARQQAVREWNEAEARRMQERENRKGETYSSVEELMKGEGVS